MQDDKNTKHGESNNHNQKNIVNEESEALKKQTEELEQKAQEYLDGWKRAKADFINYKKEQEQAFGEFVKFANQNLILQILSVLDNFNLAIEHLPEDLNNNEWAKGVLHIKTQLEDILKAQGLEEIKTTGEKFDPLAHEIIGGDNDGEVIIEEVQKGYKLRGKVVRAAKVKVGK